MPIAIAPRTRLPPIVPQTRQHTHHDRQIGAQPLQHHLSMHAQFIPSLGTDLQRALLDAERRRPQHQLPALIFVGPVALQLELLDAAVAAEHFQKGLVHAVVGVVGEVGDLQGEGGEVEMLVFCFVERAVAGGGGVVVAGDLLGPGAVVPVVDEAVVAGGLVDDLVVFVDFHWEAVGLVGEADWMVGELARGSFVGVRAVEGLVGDLDLLQVFGVGNIVGYSAVIAEVGCLAADGKGTQFWRDIE